MTLCCLAAGGRDPWVLNQWCNECSVLLRFDFEGLIVMSDDDRLLSRYTRMLCLLPVDPTHVSINVNIFVSYVCCKVVML